jgi:hypothetical protein
MNELLAKIIDTHGGMDRWNGHEKVDACFRAWDMPCRKKSLAPTGPPCRPAVATSSMSLGVCNKR